MKINIGLSDKKMKATAAILEGLLADEMVLLVKTKNFHWNVVGPQFSELHGFFDNQYEQIAESVDEIAERIRVLGHFASGSMAGYIKSSRLKEQPKTQMKAMDMVAELLDDHEAVIRQLRKDVTTTNDELEDAGTADFLTALMEKHEKMAWMLRSYLA